MAPGFLKESEKRELIVKCTDNCSCVSVDKWSDEDFYYLTFYKSYTEKGLWFRLKKAFKVLMGRDIIGAELVLEEEDFNKIRKFK